MTTTAMKKTDQIIDQKSDQNPDQNTELTHGEKLECLESTMLDHPQVECPVVHHFGPGVYVREVHLPAGTLAIGHAQRFAQLNVVLQGSVAMLGEDGHLKIVQAPAIFTGPPGRKFGYVLRDTVWQNIYATEETDIEKLEAHFLDKSATWQTHHKEVASLRVALHERDRAAYRGFLTAFELDENIIRAQSENETDQISMPEAYQARVMVRDSFIDLSGKGVFLSAGVKAYELIGPARIDGKRTPIGRYVNHSDHPNCYFSERENGNIYLMAKKPITGCMGGELGEELTVNYRQALLIHVRNFLKEEVAQ